MTHNYFLFDFDGVINPLNRYLFGKEVITVPIDRLGGFTPDNEDEIYVPGLFTGTDIAKIHWSSELITELDSLNTETSSVIWASTWLQNALSLLNPRLGVNWDTITFVGNKGVSVEQIWKFFALENLAASIPEGSVIHWVDDIATRDFIKGGYLEHYTKEGLPNGVVIHPYLTEGKVGITRDMVRHFKSVI